MSDLPCSMTVGSSHPLSEVLSSDGSRCAEDFASSVCKAELMQLICVTEAFGLGTDDCPRRIIFKYFNPDDGRLLAVCDPDEGEPDSRLYPPVKSEVKGGCTGNDAN